MPGLRFRCLVAVLAGLVTANGTARAQHGAGCTLEKQIYTCDWRAFVDQLHQAHSISIETQPMDRFTARQLRELVRKLGKIVAPKGQQGDLTFLIIPMQSTGVHIGPAGEALATLRIYAPSAGHARGELLWAETYTGDPDWPWPATVHALIEQFRDRIRKD
ncbi:MAG TPA: hypothetical protein VMD97_10575 [Candidatus Aquilonibacter sp.]|nr:hypothetical protein [Candidatus Aquilonibacter sp.]